MQEMTRIETDDSVIDISREGVSLIPRIAEDMLTRAAEEVPHWPHKYIFGAYEIRYASVEQQRFYAILKDRFLQGVYLDVGDNSNYIFVLLFELLNDFREDPNPERLNHYLKQLAHAYPVARRYALSHLVRMLQQESVLNETAEAELLDEFPDFYWTLSQRYGKQLGLTPAEKKILDQVRLSENSFNEIPFFRLLIIRTFLNRVGKLSLEYEKLQSTLDHELKALADGIARKHFRYRTNSRNYNALLHSASSLQYSALFKMCENEIRSYYSHKRRLQIPGFCTHPQLNDTFGENLFERFRILLLAEQTGLPEIDEATEIALNGLNATRWKEKFNLLKLTIHKGADFVREIRELVRMNSQNSSRELIYLEAVRFIAGKDRKAALALYLNYLDIAVGRDPLGYRELPRNISKHLFITPAQKEEFDSLVTRFIESRDLQEAFHRIEGFYEPKRRSIRIDRDHIREVQQHHSATVDLLNQYLQDEEPESLPISSQPSLTEPEIKESLADSDHSNNQKSRFIVNLNEVQQEVLSYLKDHDGLVPCEQLNSFIQTTGYLPGQVVEGINDTCYELLDDILIEEEEDQYLLNKAYYEQIIAT